MKCSVRNTCYFDGFTDPDDDVHACEKYGSGTALRAGSGSSSSGGACAYVDSRLNLTAAVPSVPSSVCD